MTDAPLDLDPTGEVAMPGMRERDSDTVRRMLARVRAGAPGPVALLLAIAVVVLIVAFAEPIGRPWMSGQDAFAYWEPRFDQPYVGSTWMTPPGYIYSPAFLQLIAPLKALPWSAFLGVWTVILLLAIRFLSGRRLFAVAIVASLMELAGGNISVLLASAIVLGFRWPAMWAFVLLTKITPGIGLLWFAVRREWRHLGIAIAATAVVAALSILVVPQAWRDWVDALGRAIAVEGVTWAAIPIPLFFRLPVAFAVVVWGALTDRRWAVPVAAMLALPALWYGGLTMLLAILPLRRTEGAGG